MIPIKDYCMNVVIDTIMVIVSNKKKMSEIFMADQIVKMKKIDLFTNE